MYLVSVSTFGDGEISGYNTLATSSNCYGRVWVRMSRIGWVGYGSGPFVGRAGRVGKSCPRLTVRDRVFVDILKCSAYEVICHVSVEQIRVLTFCNRPFSVFTPKQVFGPRTAKAQPIWIKFCIHLLLYGIHLWAYIDRDGRVGGSRPNQNVCFFL